MVELFTNNGDPDQMPRSAASDLGLHCLPITLLGVSRLQWINGISFNPFIPRFLKWTLPFLNLDMSIDVNKRFSLKSKQEWQTV